MKGVTRLAILAGLAALAGIGLYLRAPSRAVEPPRQERAQTPIPPAAPSSAEPSTPLSQEGRSLLDELRASAPVPQTLRPLASRLQRSCRTDKAVVRALADLLLDPSAPRHAREVAAFVLGSLQDVEARQALTKALDQGGDAGWMRALLLAAGSAPDRGRDGTFDYPEGPFIVLAPCGLSVEVRKAVTDPDLRAAMERQFGHADTEVRRAAAQVLQHTLYAEAAARRNGEEIDLGTLRKSYLRGMDQDAEESVRAEAGRALAEWTMIASPDSPAHAEVLGSILRKSLELEEDQLRFRALPGLKQATLAEGDLARIAEAAMRGADFEQRAWAIELAAAHAEALGAPREGAVMAAALADAEPKIREVALQQLAAMPPTEERQERARRALQDPAWNVRYAAVNALAAFSAGPESIRELERIAASDPHEEVRKRAAQLLKPR